MAVYEVFIPASDPEGFDITATIKADSWMHALRSGLARLGDPTNIKNVLCDITDSGIEVTDPNSGRVFRIQEKESGAAAAQAEPEAGAPQSAPPKAAPPPAAKAAPPPAAKAAPPPAAKAAPPKAAPPKAAPPKAAPPAAAPKAAEAATEIMPTKGERFHAEAEIEEIVKTKTTGAHKIGRKKSSNTKRVEDILGDLFEKTNDIYGCQNLREASDFILDLAMQTIPSEAGAVFIADINAQDLGFSSARGPKAKEVLNFRVPMGQGIVGFSAQEGVAVAVSDAHKDDRFYKTISDKTGYAVKSVMCSPAQDSGRILGAVELVNKKGDSSFTADEINVLNFLAHEFSQYLVNTGQTGD